MGQPTLPAYMNTTLSSIANPKKSAEVRDALRLAQSLAAFKAALEEHQQSDPTVAIFRNLYKEWAKLLPARHKATTSTPTFEVRTSTPAITTATSESSTSAQPPSYHTPSPQRREASN